MIIKIVGFKVGRDRSTCYEKIEVPNPGSLDWGIRKGDLTEKEFREKIERIIGREMWKALLKSDFISVRK